MESLSTQSGIPTVLRTVVLLERSNDANFRATLDIQAEVDVAYSISTAFKNIAGSVPRTDPIIFDIKKPIGDLSLDDEENSRLDKVQLLKSPGPAYSYASTFLK
jgi:hypothetical protein